MALDWRNLTSSNIHSAAHDAEAQELHVRFKNGGTYSYQDVDADEADDLFNAPSPGAHHHANLKHKPFRRG
jgi:hypothetical protein